MLCGLVKPPLTVRPAHGANVAPGDDAFILIICSEDNIRELYKGMEEREYHVAERMYRFCMAIGNMSLMIGFVLLGNTNFNSQVIFPSGT